MIFIDSETTGLHGVPVIFQYAINDGPVKIHEIWTTPIEETLFLIERFLDHEGGLCFFNAVFDFFHICKIYTMFSLFPDKTEYPEDHINELALIEPHARDGPCLKPKKIVDVMLVARKTKYQITMDRKDIKVKKVPNLLAQPLCEELEKRVQLPDILFAKRKNKYAPKWTVEEIEDEPDFKNLVLRFRPSSSLKALAVDALGVKTDDVILYDDIALQANEHSNENGYAPFALATGKPGKWNGTWPGLIHRHIDHWASNSYARKYCVNDVVYTRGLYDYFNQPEEDDDSILACAIAASRWRGFAIDLEKIKILKEEALKLSKSAPRAPNNVRRYVLDLLSSEERIGLQEDSTGKKILEVIAEFSVTNSEGELVPHPAAQKARNVIDARTAEKEVDLYDKLILAGRFHADFNIIGTLSSRMSGTSGLNAQGIKATKKVRDCFTLALPGDKLCGGDFISFEVVLADACYNDPILRKDLLNGKSPHAIFGSLVYSPMTYEEILASKGTANDKYKVSKNCLFSMLYGGNEYTMETKYAVSKENAEKGYQGFLQRYPIVARKRKEIQNMFCSMIQKEIHGKVEWKEPRDYIESLFGFRRYFTLENNICRILFDLAEKPPKSWLEYKIKIVRRDREQSVSGAVRSALFAAAFALQAANQRAASNHIIQSAGATVTKSLQKRIWDIQPSGIHDWQVSCLNVHDEVNVTAKPDKINQVKEVVESFIQEMKEKVPLIAIDWQSDMCSWGDK